MFDKQIILWEALKQFSVVRNFKQILPVFLRGFNLNIVSACMKRSKLWPYVNVRLELRENLRIKFISLISQLGQSIESA